MMVEQIGMQVFQEQTLANLRKLWGWKHSQVGASNTEPWPDVQRGPWDQGASGYGGGASGGSNTETAAFPDDAYNSALFYNNNLQTDEVTDPWAQLDFLYRDAPYSPVQMFALPDGTWGTSNDMNYALQPGSDLILMQINALEDVNTTWGTGQFGFDNNFGTTSWVTENRKLVPGTTSRACIYQVGRIKSNYAMVFNQTAFGGGVSGSTPPIFENGDAFNVGNVGTQASTSMDAWNTSVDLAGAKGTGANALYHSSLDRTVTSRENFLKNKGRCVRKISTTNNLNGYFQNPLYGKTVDIAYEIERTLEKYGVATNTLHIKSGTNSTRQVTVLSYVAGQLHFCAAPAQQNEGSVMYIPCYVRMHIRDYNNGRPTAHLGHAPMYRYVTVAIRLERRFCPGTYLPGSGVVIDWNMTNKTILGSPEIPFTESYISGEGWDNWTNKGYESQDELLNQPSNAGDKPVRCYRWGTNGQSFYIVGGNIGQAAPTKSGGGSNIYHCLKKIDVADETAFEYDRFYQVGTHKDANTDQFNETQFSDVEENRIIDLDPRETGIWDNAWVNGLEEYYYANQSDLFADRRTWVGSKYGFNSSATNPPEVAPKYPQSFTIDGRTYEEEILSFRWSEDGYYLYVIWGLDHHHKTSNTASGNVRSWMARYRTTQPYTPAYLKWCGETDSTDTPLTPADGANNIEDYYGIRDFTISPDRNHAIVLDNPYNGLWSDGKATYPGGATPDVTNRRRWPSLSQYNFGEFDSEYSNMPYKYEAGAYGAYVVDTTHESFRFSTNPLATSVNAPNSTSIGGLGQYGYVRKAWWKWPQNTINLGSPDSGTLTGTTVTQENFIWLNKRIVGNGNNKNLRAWSDYYRKRVIGGSTIPSTNTVSQTQYVRPTAIEWNPDGSILYCFQQCDSFSRGSSLYTASGGGSYAVSRPYGPDYGVVMYPLPVHPKEEWYPNPPRPGGATEPTAISDNMGTFDSEYYPPFLYNYTLRGFFEQSNWMRENINDTARGGSAPYTINSNNFLSNYGIPATEHVNSGTNNPAFTYNYLGTGDAATLLYRDRYSYLASDNEIDSSNVDSFAIPVRSWSYYSNATDDGQFYVPGGQYKNTNEFGSTDKVLVAFSLSGHFMTLIGQMGYPNILGSVKSYNQYIKTFPIYSDSHETLTDSSARSNYEFIGSAYDSSTPNGRYVTSNGNNIYGFFPLRSRNCLSGVTTDDYLFDTSYYSSQANQLVLGPLQRDDTYLGSLRWGSIQSHSSGQLNVSYSMLGSEDNGFMGTFQAEKEMKLDDFGTQSYMALTDPSSALKLTSSRVLSSNGLVEVSFNDIPTMYDQGGFRGSNIVRQYNSNFHSYAYRKDKRGGRFGISMYVVSYSDIQRLSTYRSNSFEYSGNYESSGTSYSLLNSTFFTINTHLTTYAEDLPQVRIVSTHAYYNASPYLYGTTSYLSDISYCVWLDRERHVGGFGGTETMPIIWKKQLLRSGDLSTAYQAYKDGGERKLDVSISVSGTADGDNAVYYHTGATNQGPWLFVRTEGTPINTSARSGFYGKFNSIRFEDNGYKLYVLWNGRAEDRYLYQGGSLVSSDPSTDQCIVLSRYNLTSPYDINTATYTNGFIIEAGPYQNQWVSFAQQRAYNSFATDFVWKPDGTKFWTIGIETTSTSYFGVQGRSCETRVREYSVGTPWDLSTVTNTNNVKAYDTAPAGINLNTSIWLPTNLELSPDGTNVYWACKRVASSLTNADLEILQFKSTLPSAYDVTNPSQTVTRTEQNATRTLVGNYHSASDGGAERLRFINSEGRLYRTNSTDTVTTTSESQSERWGQSWPMGGISVFDPKQKTQKFNGQISIGNYTMFPNYHSPTSYTQASTGGIVDDQMFNFAVSPREDIILVNDGQAVIYQLLFNNNTRKFGIGP
tara:strand:- start:4006 stop:9687 length:5682 start_codon:yes stop_codon:yes gene_type:complete